MASPDDIVFAHAPTVMAPLFSDLPQLKPGCRRYVNANDGVYLEAASRAVSMCFKVADARSQMPYGSVTPYYRLAYGPIPRALVAELAEWAVSYQQCEMVGMIVADHDARGYRTFYPQVQSASGGHVSYRRLEDRDDVVLHFHSHGFGRSYFSAIDDASDQDGVYIAGVFGNCTDQLSMTTTLRGVIHGTFESILGCGTPINDALSLAWLLK